MSFRLCEGGGTSGGDIADDIAREAKKVSLRRKGSSGLNLAMEIFQRH